MADLFGDSGSGGEEDIKPPPPQTAPSNGFREVDEAAHTQNGGLSPLDTANGDTVEEDEDQNDDTDLPPRDGEAEGPAEGPRDDIHVSVVQYQKTADDYTYDIEVRDVGVGLVAIMLLLSLG